MADATTTTTDAGATPTTDPGTTTTPAGSDDLGDKGKKALDDERAARKAAEKLARDAQAELDKLRTASMSEQEKAVAAARAEGKAEALKEATERLVRAEVRAAAGGKLADPNDAIGLLDLDSFVVANGDIDSKAISSAIDDLVKTKPYLSARPGNGAGEGGPRGTNPTAKPSALLDMVKQAVGSNSR